MNLTNFHDCSKELRELELKATLARIAVLKLLEKSPEPLDVATIQDYLRKEKVEADPVTVFRIISVFTKRGITQRVQFNEGKFRYELSSKGDHHHLICEKCGVVEDIVECNLDKLEREIESKKKFKVKSHSLEFFGLCRECQKN